MVIFHYNIVAAQWAQGESECSLRNPPDSQKEWIFYGNQRVHMTLSNFNILPVYTVLEWNHVTSSFCHFYLLPQQSTEERKYEIWGTTSISWKFYIYIQSDSGWVVGRAWWFVNGM